MLQLVGLDSRSAGLVDRVQTRRSAELFIIWLPHGQLLCQGNTVWAEGAQGVCVCVGGGGGGHCTATRWPAVMEDGLGPRAAAAWKGPVRGIASHSSRSIEPYNTVFLPTS